MKIVLSEVEAWEKTTFKPLESDHEVVFTDEPITDANADSFGDADILSVFIYSELSRQVLEKFSRLKLIATRSTGFDHIDTGYCREHDIAVSNVPTYGSNTVAEHAFGLLLAISHHLITAVDRTRRGDFSQEGIQGFDLQGKTIGIVGTGDIGENALRIASGFGMKVLAFDVKPRKELHERYDFRYVGMDELLSESDIITLHVPANPHTKNLIDREQFSKMKDGVVLINTSRGSIVNIQALARAIADGKVRAAGLDVLAEEPVVREEAELLHTLFRSDNQQQLNDLLTDHILLRMRNVIITPHSAFNTREAVQRILDTTMENIEAFMRDEPKNLAA